MRINLLALAVVLLAACSAEQNESADRGEAAYTEGMVSTAHPVATQAGLDILADGGNAFDAAVAIAATLNVVEPMMSGMGGYGTIMVYSAATKEPWYLDASGKIPVGVDPDVYRAPTPDYMANRVGPKAVSTPGATRAWEAMHERFGTLEWAALKEVELLPLTLIVTAMSLSVTFSQPLMARPSEPGSI